MKSTPSVAFRNSAYFARPEEYEFFVFGLHLAVRCCLMPRSGPARWGCGCAVSGLESGAKVVMLDLGLLRARFGGMAACVVVRFCGL